jgi:hypothetical protein
MLYRDKTFLPLLASLCASLCARQVVTVTDRRSEVMSRRYRDVCELDAQLRLLFPAAVFLDMTDLRQPQLMRAKKTSEVCHMCPMCHSHPPFVRYLSF